MTKKRVKYIVITVIIALLEFILVNHLVAVGLAPGGKVDSTLSMLLTCLSYFIISGVFLNMNEPVADFWVAIVAFIFLCIFLFYSTTLTDLLAFLVLSVGMLSSMTILNEKIHEKESRDKEDN